MYQNGKKKNCGFGYIAHYKRYDMKQTVAVIKYNAGNVQSVLFALERYNVLPVLTDNPETIRSADKVLFPGVGEASTTMNYLRQRGLDSLISGLQQPVLGICLGLQLMCTHSEENNTDCLGILPIEVKKFNSFDGHKVPHMGWNQLKINSNSWLPKRLNNEYCYFVHSYYAQMSPHTAASTEYGVEFTSVVKKDNFYATQFHVEKSGPIGLKIVETFLSIKN